MYNKSYSVGHPVALVKESLYRKAPSIFAERSCETTSSKYVQIPTYQVLEELEKEGWFPVFASESKARKEEKIGFTKHIVRLRHSSDIDKGLVKGDTIKDICLINSHDGASSYQLHAGLFRVACLNGLVVADSTLSKQCVRHQGDILGDVIEGVYSIVEDFPKVIDRMDAFKSISLSRDAQMAMAKAAISLRWDEDKAPIAPENLLTVRRSEDKSVDLWTSFNVVQENLTKSTYNYVRDEKGRSKRVKTREVKSIDESTRLNKALWTLADEMAKILS